MIDGIVYCPLYEEIQIAQEIFTPEDDFTSRLDILSYSATCADQKLLFVSPNEMGTATAQSVIRRIKTQLDPRYIICLGICGAISDDLTLGDVCYSQEIIDINENQKHDGKEIKYNPRTYNSSNGFDKKLGYLAVHPLYKAHYDGWTQQAQELAIADLRASFSKDDLQPTALRGPIACGPVIANERVKKRITALNRKILCIETETSGIYQAIDNSDSIEVIAIRGVSDLADSNKKLTEAQNKNAFRRIAARNAATFLKAQLTYNPFFYEGIKELASSPSLPFEEQPDPIKGYLNTITSITEARLAELSPDYRAQSRGYRLPVPRVREASEDMQRPPLEPADLLLDARSAVIEVPSTYPDRGLPWVYAKNLLGQTVDSKIVIPLVIDGSEISPPKGTISSALSRMDLVKTLENPNVRPVLILFNVPFTSRSRMSFIANEIAQHSDLITIVLANGPYQSLLSYSNSVATWKKYALCDVSFQSIVQFLNVHFLIDAKEAEVIALRLSETFRNFNISIHPSYFAGIPKEMLTRFTEANNRAEIIDLAVTGFLSFFGAGETDEVTLKQRTRRLFLRELAYRNLVLKEPMDLSSVVDFVCDYSAKKDFGIEPVDFINSFVRYGILNSNNNIVDFNIPFIQNYLLAQRLADDPENARRYFDPALGEIDFHTFELYSEIGLSPQVLDAVSNRLDRHISQFGELIGESDYSRSRRADDRSYKENGHILVTGKVRPRFLNGYRKISGHRERLEKLSNDLLSDDSKTESKQRVLDLSDRAREVVTEQKEAGEESGRVNSAQTEIGRDWVMGVIMLGSAAEELDAEIKRELVKKLVSLLALILDDWISSVARIDFEIIKSELSSEMEAHLLEEGEKFGDDHRSFIDMVVDLVEMKELDGPFMSVMHILCEYARNKILLNSVNGVSAEDSVEALVIALWKLELRCDQGIRPLRSALTNLPKDAFLRILVADYLIARAYWYRSENSTRHDYVDGAKESLKPLQLTFDADSILGEKE